MEDKGTREAWDVRLGTDAPAPTIAAGAVHAAIMDIERYGRSAARDEGLYAPLKRYDVWCYARFWLSDILVLYQTDCGALPGISAARVFG